MARTKEQDRERKRKQKQDANEIGDLPKVKNPRRRKRCQKSLYDFLCTYCTGLGGFLKSAPSVRMREIIDKLQDTVINGGRTHVRLARGHGKTSIIKGATVFALAYGYRHFVVVVAAKRGDASAICEDLFNLLEVNAAFAEDFPEIAYPIAKLEGVLQRSHNQTHHGERTRMGKTAERIVLPSIKGSVSSGATIIARGFKGATRGLVRGAMRPDLVLFDDIQDDKVARNPAIVAQYDETLEKSFMGLGGHDKTIASFMSSTPICPDDLSELYATKPSWRTFTYPMIVHEPECWRSANDLWQQYFSIRKDSIAAGEPEHERCNEFYKEHRAEMDAGGEVLNPDFYDHDTELSGIQHAMNLRFANSEEAFAAEYMMRPMRKHEVFRISAPLIAGRVRPGSAEFDVPPDTVFTACATDVNPSYGLSTAIVTFAKDQTGFVSSYALFSKAPIPISDNMPDRRRVALITEALVKHGREIATWCKQHGVIINRWGVDCGGKQWDAVCGFSRQSRALCGVGCMPMAGRAGKNWNPLVKSRIADPRNDTVLCEDKSKGWRWLAFNSDVWRETAQRAWLGEPGTPGSLSIFDGKRHGEFAAQVAAEVLEWKIVLPNGQTEYRWKEIGRKHDLGDALTMCYALAGQFGISASGYIPPVARATAKKRVRTFKRGRYCK